MGTMGGGNPAEVAHGYMLSGLMVNILLFGIMITQVYMYYSNYRRDAIWMKLLVAFIFLGDIANTGFFYAYLYRTLIVHFGNVENLNIADWVFATEASTTAIVACSVQLFFAWRIWILTKSYILVGVVTAFSLTSGIAGIITSVEIGKTPEIARFQEFKGTVITWLGATAIADLLIAGILVYSLQHKTGFQRSDMILDRIIRLTVQTGLITMIIAALDLIFFLADPSGLHLFFSIPLSKLYSNSLMSSLNARRTMLNSSHGTGPFSEDHNTTTEMKITAGPQPKRTEILSYPPPRPEVFIHVESHELSESMNRQGMAEKGEISTPKSSMDQDSKWATA